MDNWITKVRKIILAIIAVNVSTSQVGFPLITVTENSDGIHVRQDRFLDGGAPSAAENETIWHVDSPTSRGCFSLTFGQERTSRDSHR
jgi:hypothetical protein